MGTEGRSTEELFLKVFKFVVLAILGLALLATVGALGVAAYQSLQSPNTVAPAKKAEEKGVSGEDFLKQLNAAPKTAPKKEGEEEPAAAAPEAAPKAEPLKYKEEAVKMIACSKDSASKAGLDGSAFTEESEENFRNSLQRIADDPSKDRTQAYVVDALKVGCALLGNAKVIAFHKANPQEEVFGRIMNFHLTAWDQMKQEARKFERDEEARVKAAEEAEAARIAQARATALAMLTLAGIAFGIFMATALYLIIAAVESNLRNINRNIEAFRTHQAVPQKTEPTL